ncbi:sugar porter family MFS transporter [Flavobacterium aurantiibacter]|uniref:D-xylose transporter XylE n=1 Tax=Flavobacterium aurantiibacter TaxID=2023067 RepID=A0A255ZUA4_9FLAO|nr:sugar porter family MFS transporter [Flavobacterium aurantiibacter]OYQ44340.1 D-xylose transporter XylE [Flavobacterium aurantiibacter]
MPSSNQKYLRYITFSAALGGLLFGYDTAVISGAIGSLTNYFELTAVETGWAISSALVGCLIGAFFSDSLSSRYGRKPTMLISAVLFTVNSVGTAIPESFSVFVFFRIVGGVGVGLASMVVPMYLAEIAPAKKRGALVANYQLAIVLGIVLVYFVNYFIALQGDTQWNLTTGWRWMFGSEVLPSILFLVCLFLIPESPRWLATQGKYQQKQAVLDRINSREEAEAARREIDEHADTTSNNQWKTLFKPTFRKVLFVGVVLSVLQQFCGINAILYYAPEIFKNLGSSANASLLETSVLGVVNLIFTLLAIKWVDKMGRKPLLLIGSVGMTVGLLGVGICVFYTVASYLILPFLLLFMASFSVSWGPVVWVLLSEIFPSKIRSLALAISVFIQWIANFLVTQFFPVLVANEWLDNYFNGAFPFYLFAIICLFSVFFVWKRIPETKNKTLEQMESLWN